MAAPHKQKLTEVVVSTKVIPVFGGTANINTGDTHLRSEAQPLFGRGKPSSGILRSGMSGLLVEIAGSGTAGTAPNIDAFWEMCGLIGTNDPGVSEIYAYGATLNHVSSTVGVFQGDALQQDMADGVGTAIITGEVGKPLMASLDYLGRWTAPTEASNAVVLATSADAPILKAATMTLNSDDLVWRSFELALNNTLTERPDASEANGIAVPLITNRNNTLKLVFETPDFSTANHWTDWNASTKLPFSLVVGATAGNIITIAGDTYIAAAPTITEDGELYVTELDLEFSEIVADTQISIAFT